MAEGLCDRTVTYSQPGHATGASGSGVSGDVENGYQLVIINDEGAALPSTGGSGTILFYLTCVILTGIAGAGLVIQKRRRTA